MKKGSGEGTGGRKGEAKEKEREKRDPCENKTKRSDCRLFGV